MPGGYQTIYDEEPSPPSQSHSQQPHSSQPQFQPPRQSQQHVRKNSEADAKILSSLDQRLNPNNSNVNQSQPQSSNQGREERLENSYHSIE